MSVRHDVRHPSPPIRGDRLVTVRTSAGRRHVFPDREVGQMTDCQARVRKVLEPGERIVEVVSTPQPTRRKRLPTKRTPCRRGEGRSLQVCLEHLGDFPLQDPACERVLLGTAPTPPRSRTWARIVR